MDEREAIDMEIDGAIEYLEAERDAARADAEGWREAHQEALDWADKRKADAEQGWAMAARLSSAYWEGDVAMLEALGDYDDALAAREAR